MKNDQFHIPFLHSLVIIAAVTLVSMVSSKYFVEKYLFNDYNNPSFSSAQSYTSSK